MSYFAQHYIIGNDAPPWAIALTRAIIAAVIVGLLSFLTMWSTTNDVKTLIIAGATPALTLLAVRFGLEGAIDQRKNGGNG